MLHAMEMQLVFSTWPLLHWHMHCTQTFALTDACCRACMEQRLRGWCVQVIELPLKHPELFESLGIAQPKVCCTDYLSCSLQQYCQLQPASSLCAVACMAAFLAHVCPVLHAANV